MDLRDSLELMIFNMVVLIAGGASMLGLGSYLIWRGVRFGIIGRHIVAQKRDLTGRAAVRVGIGYVIFGLLAFYGVYASVRLMARVLGVPGA